MFEICPAPAIRRSCEAGTNEWMLSAVSKRRAEAVVASLVKDFGISPLRLTANGAAYLQLFNMLEESWKSFQDARQMVAVKKKFLDAAHPEPVSFSKVVIYGYNMDAFSCKRV